MSLRERHHFAGANTSTTSINLSGIYTLTVTNTNSCKVSNNYTVNASSISPTDICSVSLDSLTNSNLIIWNKPISTAIDSFIIYRENNIGNQFDRLSAQAYSSFSTYLDNTSFPLSQSYRYKLGIRDT